jgi:hypothetical protein
MQKKNSSYQYCLSLPAGVKRDSSTLTGYPVDEDGYFFWQNDFYSYAIRWQCHPMM